MSQPIPVQAPSRSAGRPRRLGLLTPYKELPGEYSDVLSVGPRPVLSWQVVTQAADSHTPDDLRAMAAIEALADGVRRLSRWRPDAAMWACTSGSFILGAKGSIEQARQLTDLAGVPVRSTSLAFVAALSALQVTEVAILSPYPEAATSAFIAYLAEWGIVTTDAISLGHPGATSSEGVRGSGILSDVERLDGGDIVLIPDTATWGFELWNDLRGASRKAVLTANQVTAWLGLALLGQRSTDDRFGVLRGVGAEDPVPTAVGTLDVGHVDGPLDGDARV